MITVTKKQASVIAVVAVVAAVMFGSPMAVGSSSHLAHAWGGGCGGGFGGCGGCGGGFGGCGGCGGGFGHGRLRRRLGR